MGLVFDVSLRKPLNEFLENINRFLLSGELLKDADLHLNQLSSNISPKINTKVGLWSMNATIAPHWKVTNQFNFAVDCQLKASLDEIIEDIDKSTISILVCPSGCGKSILCPAFTYAFVERCLRKGSSPHNFTPEVPFKVVHILPTGEQCHQNSKYVREAYLQWFETSSYTSAHDLIGGEMNTFDENQTNYLYCTHFFGMHAMESDGLFHAVIIDEIHEMSPTVVHLFLLIKQKIEKGQIWKVIFLTASMPTWLYDAINNYFGSDNVSLNIGGQSPYAVQSVILGSPNDPIGRQAINQVDLPIGSVDEQTLYNNECKDDSDRPNYGVLPDTTHIVKRAIEQAYKLCEDFLSQYENMIDIPKTGGVIIFLPGSGDAALAYTEFTRRRQNLPHAQAVDVYLVNGNNRGDIPIIREESKNTSFRVVFSNHVLTNGVTLMGIDNVIDTGIQKIPRNHNIQNINALVCMFQDQSSMINRKGRVGRKRNGFYYTSFTETRMSEMERTGRSYIKLMSMYQSNNMVQLLNYQNQFLQVDQALLAVLLLECGIQGWFDIDHMPNPTLRTPRINCIGKALSHCFSDIPLDCGLFLLYSASLGVLLPAIIFVASYLNHHCLLKRPSSGGDRFGRNDSDYPMNGWPRIVGGTIGCSDMLLYIEIITNIWMSTTGRTMPVVMRQRRVTVPEDMIERFINQDIFWNLNRSIINLVCSLISIRVIDSFDDVFIESHSGLVYNIRNNFGVFQLTDERKRAFNVAVLGAFGSRVAGQKNTSQYEKNMGRIWNRTVFKIPEGTLPGTDRVRLIMGERSVPSHPFQLIVYHSTFEHTDEPYTMTYIHQVWPLHVLLFANAYGSYNDHVDIDKKQLTIYGLTGSSLFQFHEVETLHAIAQYRKLMKLIPSTTCFGRRSLCYDLYHLADNELHHFITVKEIQDRPPPTIDDYHNCYGIM